MSDYDREEVPREPVRETRRTTGIDTGDRSGGGAGGAIALILLLIVVGGIAWFLMRSGNRGATQVGVNVTTPKAIDIKVPDKIDVKVPDVNVKSDKGSANASR
ncbi:MAG: hypothetical protein JO013_09645 [Alphaproteobacteria bacterium]|nr:hypothetical protein [Alphaproteobacteria bacterium]